MNIPQTGSSDERFEVPAHRPISHKQYLHVRLTVLKNLRCLDQCVKALLHSHVSRVTHQRPVAELREPAPEHPRGDFSGSAGSVDPVRNHHQIVPTRTLPLYSPTHSFADCHHQGRASIEGPFDPTEQAGHQTWAQHTKRQSCIELKILDIAHEPAAGAQREQASHCTHEDRR